MRNYRTFVGAAGVILCGSLALPTVSAAPILVNAVQSTENPSTFSLDFGAFGGIASALISSTQFSLEIDTELGVAQFNDYDQHIAPLTLPGGYSTGNLHVRVVPGSSTGTFDDRVGEFRTSETYEINFDGDLSAYGLTSPVYLPSASVGTVTVNAVNGGNVALRWEGSSFLPNPFQPGAFFEFDYTCSVDAAFAPTASNLIDMNLLPAVQASAVSTRLKSTLLASLIGASDSLDAEESATAIWYLERFNTLVDRQTGAGIPTATAALWITNAQAAINSLGDPDGGVIIVHRNGPKGRDSAR